MATETDDRKKQQLAERYEQHHAAGDKYGFIFGGEERGRILAEWMGSGRKVLDVGCRDGSLSRFFAANNDVVGIDIDRVALERCQANLGIETHWADVTAGLPFDDASFDAANCSEVLEHIPYPDQVISEIARVLKPGALFIGSVPNSARLKNRLLWLAGKQFDHDRTHLHTYTPDLLASYLDPHFGDISFKFAISRFIWLCPALTGNTMCFRCVRLG